MNPRTLLSPAAAAASACLIRNENGLKTLPTFQNIQKVEIFSNWGCDTNIKGYQAALR
jgi:hypothetical protein